ncbi:calcium:proton antiporter [Peredibacter sp. HCB2-198]|uniref:calcium:proton antiporter n=1 Tax=Peredibacter sp. HCB2-198 TaxID=3383025 RepID=UPI0038B4472E
MSEAQFQLKSIFQTKHLIPLLALLILIFLKSSSEMNLIYSLVALALLGISVMTSVHHAEVIAHKIGEGLGTLVLALSVTIIEVGLILSLMSLKGPDASVLARDTVFAAVMIVTNGIVALCLILGGIKFREQEFQVQGSRSLLVVLIALSFLIFVLPIYSSAETSSFSPLQGIIISAISLILYALFIIFQTKTHKGYFEPTTANINVVDEQAHDEITKAEAWLSFASLCISLIAVIGLAKLMSPTIENFVVMLGAPKSSVGLIIATIVLLPEAWAAVSAARANRLQTSLNLALGSGIASIALTIPVVIGYSIITNTELILGVTPKNLVFMAMTFSVGIITLGTGKSTLLQGAVHGGILTAYFLMSFVP